MKVWNGLPNKETGEKTLNCSKLETGQTYGKDSLILLIQQSSRKVRGFKYLQSSCWGIEETLSHCAKCLIIPYFRPSTSYLQGQERNILHLQIVFLSPSPLSAGIWAKGSKQLCSTQHRSASTVQQEGTHHVEGTVEAEEVLPSLF